MNGERKNEMSYTKEQIKRMKYMLQMLGKDPDHRVMTRETCETLMQVCWIMEEREQIAGEQNIRRLQYLATHPGAEIFLDRYMQESIRRATDCLKNAENEAC